MTTLQTYNVDFPFGITRLIISKNNEETGNICKFSPRLSIQRYATVGEVIKDFAKTESIETVTEFGSGSFTFFCQYLQRYHFLTEVNQIDYDLDIINSAIHLIAWKRFHTVNYTRKNKLKVNVFHGNIAQCDSRILHSDVVIGIELIEHLFPNDFENFPSTVFDFIKPKIAVFTTPNHDFNELFGNNNKFRHHDHKFEFSRIEFQNWTNEIIKKFPDYQVQIYGIGEPPEGQNRFGYCSQMAIFKKVSSSRTLQKPSKEKNYTLIGSYIY